MKTDRIITLDMGADGIRMGVFACSASGLPQLLDSGFAPFPSDLPDELPREAVVAMTLKKLMEGKKAGTNKVSLSIEGQSVFSRLVKLPAVGKDQQEKTIRHEAIQNIPFPIDEVVWDAHVIDPETAELEVLLVAVKSELVEGLVHAVSANGYTIERISVAPVALANAVRAEKQDASSVLLVDAGHQTINLVFVDGPRTFFRTLPMVGSDPERLIQEIERSITFYRGQQVGHDPARILVRGDAVSPDMLEGRLSVPVGQVDPSICSVCAGLAHHQALPINLIPASLQQKQDIKKRQPLWFASAVVLLLLIAVWIVNLDLQVKQARNGIGLIKEEIAALKVIEQQILPVEEQIDQLTGQASLYEIALKQRILWLETLSEISRLLPEGMFLISSEPIRPMGRLTGTRISVVSYLDKEPEGQDAVKLLRDTLRNSERFSNQTKVFSRPSKKKFVREFVLDVDFAGDES